MRTYKSIFKYNFPVKNTLIGPHRDDLLILLNGKAIKVFGSQGQQRIASLCLKFCELEILKKKLNRHPVLLLDDVLSELDNERELEVLKLIKGRFQTFITTSNINYLNDFKEIENINIKKFLVTTDKILEKE